MIYTWTRRGGYEVSSVGDRRFSAFYARMPDGRNIESWYMCDVKGYQPGGVDWRLGKGQPPLDGSKNLEWEYFQLWRTWSLHNFHLVEDLAELSKSKNGVLSDCFASTNISQANALSRVLNEFFNGIVWLNPN